MDDGLLRADNEEDYDEEDVSGDEQRRDVYEQRSPTKEHNVFTQYGVTASSAAPPAGAVSAA